MPVARLVMLPPQSPTTREWAERLRRDVPELDVVVPESTGELAGVISTTDAAFGTLAAHHVGIADRLRWLQAPAAAPDAGYYSDELIEHPVVVTNLRGIYNDHVAAHAVALVLALARGLHRTMADQANKARRPYLAPAVSVSRSQGS